MNQNLRNFKTFLTNIFKKDQNNSTFENGLIKTKLYKKAGIVNPNATLIEVNNIDVYDAKEILPNGLEMPVKVSFFLSESKV